MAEYIEVNRPDLRSEWLDVMADLAADETAPGETAAGEPIPTPPIRQGR